MSWPFAELRPLTYGLIMADPPWEFALYGAGGSAKSAQAHYGCMGLAAIEQLPVSHLAAGDCWLWLWATHPMLPQALKVMAAWGFLFVTSGVWVKTTASGKLSFGTGYVLRSSSEPFLIGRVGEPALGSKSIRTAIEGPRREHSRKPDEAYAACEALFPAFRRADLFARQTRPGWDAWGNDTDKFPATTPTVEVAA